MAFRKSAPRPNYASPGAAKTAKPLITIVAEEDIAVWPTRTQGSVMMSGDFVMKQDCRMYQFYGTPSKGDGSYEGAGEEDSAVITHKYVAEHPGDDVDSENFVQSWLGIPVIIITDFCDGSPKRVIGTQCAPVQLKPTFTANNEKTGFTFTFEAYASTSLLPGRYTGNIITADPFAVADNEALALAPPTGYQYKLAEDATGGSIAVATNTLEAGSIVTLIGSGGSDPSTLTAGVNVLLNSTWTALAGAVISLEVYESNSTTYLIERNRA